MSPHFSFDIQIDMSYSIGMTNRDLPKTDVVQGTLDVMVRQMLAVLGRCTAMRSPRVWSKSHRAPSVFI